MKKAVIISGGKIQTDFALDFLKKNKWDFVIGADRGLVFCHHQQILPTHIVRTLIRQEKKNMCITMNIRIFQFGD